MPKNIQLSDFGDLALCLKPTLTTHGVPDDQHYSIISDAVFAFANFLDEKTGSSFHGQVDGVLDDYIDELTSGGFSDFLVAELVFRFGKGRKEEMNMLNSHVEDREELKLNLEVSLGIRDIDELDTEIDACGRFTKLMKKKNGIKSIDYNSAQNLEDEQWQSVSLSGSDLGEFDQSLDGMLDCLYAIARQNGWRGA